MYRHSPLELAGAASSAASAPPQPFAAFSATGTQRQSPPMMHYQQYQQPVFVHGVHPHFKRSEDPAELAAMLLGSTPSRSDPPGMESVVLLHRPRSDSVASTASLQTLAEVAQRELEQQNAMLKSQLQSTPQPNRRVESNEQGVIRTPVHRSASVQSATPDRMIGDLSSAAVPPPVDITNSHIPASLAFYLSPTESTRYNLDGRVGIYTQPQRKNLLNKYYERRRQRVWKKKVRYNCRKNLANNRLRIKGRFVKADSEEAKAYYAAQAAASASVGADDAASTPSSATPVSVTDGATAPQTAFRSAAAWASSSAAPVLSGVRV